MSPHETVQSLAALLQRALTRIPLIRLDKVDEVTKLFQSAYDFMEKSCEEGPSYMDKENGANLGLLNRLQSAAVAPPQKQPKTAKSGFEPRPLATKLEGAPMTEDYSSPSLVTRRLGSKVKRFPDAEEPDRGNGRIKAFEDALADDDNQDKPSPFGKEQPHSNGVTKHSSDPPPKKSPFPADMAPPVSVNPRAAARSSISDCMTTDFDSPSLKTRKLVAKQPAKDEQRAPMDEDKIPEGSPSQMATMRLINLASAKPLNAPATPKALFLRGLDHPGTRHHELKQGKHKLNELIKSSMSKLSLVPESSLQELRMKLERAVLALEEGTLSQNVGRSDDSP